MKVIETSLPGVLIFEPTVFEDERGYFFESWNARRFRDATGADRAFVHYQLNHPQGKLIRVCRGEVLDVAVDLRRSSPYFSKWTKVALSAENRRQLWIPPGFGHGFVVRSEFADVLYKVTDYWNPSAERCVLWSDPQLAIDWELQQQPILSERDAEGARLADTELFA